MKTKLILTLLTIFLTFLKADNNITINNIDNPIIKLNFKNNLFQKNLIGTFTNKPLLLCDKELGGSYEYDDTDSLIFYIETKITTSQLFSCELNSKFFTQEEDKIFIKTRDFTLLSTEKSKYRDVVELKLVFSDMVLFSCIKNGLIIDKLSYTIFPKQDSKGYTLCSFYCFLR